MSTHRNGNTTKGSKSLSCCGWKPLGTSACLQPNEGRSQDLCTQLTTLSTVQRPSCCILAGAAVSSLESLYFSK